MLYVNRILLYARTSLVRFCAEYVSLFFVFLLELALIDSLFFFLTKLKKTITLVALRMVFVEVFLAFSAIAALLVGISVGRLWTSREQQGRTPDPVPWDDRCQPNSRRGLGRAPKSFGGEPTQFKEWIFAVDLSLRMGMIKDGQDQVDFASSFLEGTALLWFLSCLESRRTFANWAELKESLSATFGPLDEEEDDRLNLFALTQTGPLDDYIQDFSRLSLNVTAFNLEPGPTLVDMVTTGFGPGGQ